MKLLLFLFSLFMDWILYSVFKMRIKTIIFCVILEITAFIAFSNAAFYSFFLCFFIIGIIKLLRNVLFGCSDVSTYKISNFLYSAGIPIFISIIEPIALSFEKLSTYQHSIELLLLCCIASIIADTSASEIGQMTKSKTYSILTFKKVKPGYDGGISFFGTFGSLITTLIFLLVSSCYITYNNNEFLLVYLFSILSCMLDSVLGASLQKKKIISNEHTNFRAIAFTFTLLFFI